MVVDLAPTPTSIATPTATPTISLIVGIPGMWLFPAGETTGLGDWYFGFSRPGEKLPVVQSVRTSGQRAVDECTHVPTSLNQPSSNQHSNPHSTFHFTSPAPTSTLNAVGYDDSGGAAKTAGSRATRLGEHDGRGGTKKPAESHATCLTGTIACSSIGFKLSSIWGVRHLGFPSRINYQASSRCER